MKGGRSKCIWVYRQIHLIWSLVLNLDDFFLKFCFFFYFKGKFKSREVVDALIYLVSNDEEPNVRTVAAICLAQTGANDDVTIQALIDVLEDKDRLVREAGCLALGRSQAHKAVPTLLELW